MSDTITITGNIATDPTKSTLPSGVPVTRFRLASGTRRFDRETNQWVDGATNWYSVSAYRALAENSASSLRKGERVVVTGRLRLRTWDNDGHKGMDAEVDAEALGHDLRFGTSAFQRMPARSAPADGDGADAWATPGTSMTEERQRTPEPDPRPEAEPAEAPF